MSESAFIRLLGFVTALVGVVGAVVAQQTGATLFVPFALVLAVTGGVVGLFGWSLRART